MERLSPSFDCSWLSVVAVLVVVGSIPPGDFFLANVLFFGAQRAVATDPELKGGRSSSLQTYGGLLRRYNKKRGRFCASRVTYAANGQKPAVVPARNAQFQKSRMTPATEKSGQTRQDFLCDFFWSTVVAHDMNLWR